MKPVGHGTILPLDPVLDSPVEMNELGADGAPKPPSFPFGYMFPELQRHRRCLLEESKTTVDNLRRLGKDGMHDPTIDKAPGVVVPAIYTFFGQFVDHDISREKGSSSILLSNPYPIDPKLIPTQIVNSRSPNLDLDHVYGPDDVDGELAPPDKDDPNKLAVGSVVKGLLGPIPGKGIYHDLPRWDNGSPKVG